ncbi:hypothetical protein DL991_10475 [Amycolatopsis sp. WAC 01375]|uniref:hypothetical protein n=1 Tax=Amycolatopsis sp. WAC 01375 TaxID=2203194 RepID=UPI0010011DC3|nr:hypothetical protein [Amycolatopsis sp. WAC 01375]RSM80533.1 hypothetical protein DL991_10475 [Amycolatopsis sp. WAC 01375]
MTWLEVIIAVAAILLATVVAALLVLGGLLAWYIGAAERRSVREFTRIHDPVPALELGQLDTAPDRAGQPRTGAPSRSGSDAVSRSIDPRPRKDR